jgi:hypothetical protein
VQSQLVLVPFHVIRDQQFVRTLTASDIAILEDGEEREISVDGYLLDSGSPNM